MLETLLHTVRLASRCDPSKQLLVVKAVYERPDHVDDDITVCHNVFRQLVLGQTISLDKLYVVVGGHLGMLGDIDRGLLP